MRDMVELRHFDAAGDREEIFAAVAADGGVIVENLLTEDTCDALMQDFHPHLSDIPWGADDLGYRDEFYGTQTKRLHGLFSKSGAMADVLMHPFLLAMANHFLVDSRVSRDFRLSNSELMVLNQHQDVQAFHSDAASWHRAQQMDSEEILVSANIALTPFTETNGATRVVPGSHRWDDPAREPTEAETCLAVMPRGAALLYTGNVIHSGGANSDAMLRVGLYLGYMASWLRPLENYLITCDPADIMAMSEDARRLLDVVPDGFTVYA